MQDMISKKLIAAVRPRPKPFEIRDSRLKGFLLRVQPSGAMTYYVEFARGRRVAIGRVGVVELDTARDRAKGVLAEAYQGHDPIGALRKANAQTLGSFLDDVYAPWARSNIKTAEATLARLKFSFAEFLEAKLGEITPWQIEKWRSRRLEGGAKATTVNRDLDDIRSSLARAVAWSMLPASPLATVRRLRVDPNAVVRFLSDEEDSRLRSALEHREQRIRLTRASANHWRITRGYRLQPDLSEVVFADRLRPMILLSLNTGLRRGELFNLKWADIDFTNSNLTVHGFNTKSGTTRHVPLNDEAIWALREWQRADREIDGIVFPGKISDRLNNVRRSWGAILDAAGIARFRWHDMRHTFASRLVMGGVDLNTVRELLGHSDYKMTLRYAHLAPEHKAAAVAKLSKRSNQSA
jgi:integrase